MQGFVAFASVVAAVLVCPASPALAWPPEFFTEPVAAGWNQPVGLAFAPAGLSKVSRMLVWEKGGRVWTVEDGLRLTEPLIDLSAEVGNWRDHGLLGLAIDPNFNENGYFYVLYVVDYHHLAHFGTPEYDPAADEYFRDTIGRVTRYTCDASNNFRSVLPDSRRVLIGETMSTGFPLCHHSHGVGGMVFGEDGTLLISCGDGGSYQTVDVGGPTNGSSNTALADGIIREAEDVGAFRAQLVDSMNGKVLRIDPATGDGVESNPFYDPARPRSAQSRVWAMGFRNPYRLAVRPGSGSADPTAGDPGTLMIGDVGWFVWEELNVAETGGLNFGWPQFEGFLATQGYSKASVPNRDERNPFYQPNGDCTQEFFFFGDLIIQDTLDPDPSFPNPCNPEVEIPETTGRFVHSRPAIDWGHGGPSRCGGYIGFTPVVYDLGAPGAPVAGSRFWGACSTGGVWCPGTNYPSEYHNAYFHADFIAGWIKHVVFDDQDNPVEVRDFTDEAGPVVAMAADPMSGDLFYIAYTFDGAGSVHRVRYAGNHAPVATASAGPAFGPTPLSVQFSSAGSEDPENTDLTFHWDFGDGTPPSSEPNPTHVYQDAEDITGDGTFTAHIFSLDPPEPTGGGSRDPEVLRDHDYPPAGSDDLSRQYDTYHWGQQGFSDWVGYLFPTARQFHSLIFQEGRHFFDGGWFNTLRVQYRSTSGQWVTVQGVQVSPAYPGNNGVSYETFTLSFPPVTGTGIRIEGVPGGSARFISVGELRVFAAVGGRPTRRDATLTVTDADGASSTATVTVSLNNTPPVVRITSPIDGAIYTVCDNVVVPLTAEISDAEHGADELGCSWQTILHHNEHTHPETPDPNCETTTTLTSHGGDGDEFHFEIQLTVTDAAGLSTTEWVEVHAVCCEADWDASGELNSQDFFDFLAAFFANNADFNGNGETTSQDFFDFLSAFFEGC